MTNQELARQFKPGTSHEPERDGANLFQIRRYCVAVAAINRLDTSLSSLFAQGGRAASGGGIGLSVGYTLRPMGLSSRAARLPVRRDYSRGVECWAATATRDKRGFETGLAPSRSLNSKLRVNPRAASLIGHDMPLGIRAIPAYTRGA